MAESDFQSDRPEPPRRRPAKRSRAHDYEDLGDDDLVDDPVQTLVPYKNPRALMAYYFGVFSFVPLLGILIGPIAIILGFLGFRYGQAHPTAKGTGHAVAGMVFGVLGTLANVVAIAMAVRYIFGIGTWGRWF